MIHNMLLISGALFISVLPLSKSLTTVSLACAKCKQPTFPPGGRLLYLPHCIDGQSLNYCDAVCAQKKVRSTLNYWRKESFLVKDHYELLFSRKALWTKEVVRTARKSVEWFSYLYAVKTKRPSILTNARLSVQVSKLTLKSFLN